MIDLIEGLLIIILILAMIVGLAYAIHCLFTQGFSYADEGNYAGVLMIIFILWIVFK